MKYRVYKNISNVQHERFNQDLYKLRISFIKLIDGSEFFPNKKSAPDYLTVDFKYKKDNYFGNIGVSFEDVDGSSFQFYVSKARDDGGDRYFKSVTLIKGVDIEVISYNLPNLIENALFIFRSWGDEDLKLLDV